MRLVGGVRVSWIIFWGVRGVRRASRDERRRKRGGEGEGKMRWRAFFTSRNYYFLDIWVLALLQSCLLLVYFERSAAQRNAALTFVLFKAWKTFQWAFRDTSFSFQWRAQDGRQGKAERCHELHKCTTILSIFRGQRPRRKSVGSWARLNSAGI
jgi:hypothetical protein